MKKIYMVLIAIVLICMTLGCSGNNANTNTSQPVVSEPAQQPAQQAVQEKAAPMVIATFNGTSTKDTETFHVDTDQCKISWDTKAGQYGGNFIFSIYDANGTYKAAGANVVGTNADSTILRGAGDYYLSIISTQPYTITVETI